MIKTGFTRFFLLAGLLLLFCLNFSIAHESHLHEHGHQHDHDDDHQHNDNPNHSDDSSSLSQPRSNTHEHVHHHGHSYTDCGGDHDEGHHQEELERIKYETIEVKFTVLKQRAIVMTVLAGLLILISIFRFKKSKG